MFQKKTASQPNKTPSQNKQKQNQTLKKEKKILENVLKYKEGKKLFISLQPREICFVLHFYYFIFCVHVNVKIGSYLVGSFSYLPR